MKIVTTDKEVCMIIIYTTIYVIADCIIVINSPFFNDYGNEYSSEEVYNRDTRLVDKLSAQPDVEFKFSLIL